MLDYQEPTHGNLIAPLSLARSQNEIPFWLHNVVVLLVDALQSQYSLSQSFGCSCYCPDPPSQLLPVSSQTSTYCVLLIVCNRTEKHPSIFTSKSGQGRVSPVWLTLGEILFVLVSEITKYDKNIGTPRLKCSRSIVVGDGFIIESGVSYILGEI